MSGVQTSLVLPPSVRMGRSFRWVFGFCTWLALLSWKGLVLHEPTLVLVNHSSYCLHSRKEGNRECSLFSVTTCVFKRVAMNLLFEESRYWKSGILFLDLDPVPKYMRQLGSVQCFPSIWGDVKNWHYVWPHSKLYNSTLPMKSWRCMLMADSLGDYGDEYY